MIERERKFLLSGVIPGYLKCRYLIDVVYTSAGVRHRKILGITSGRVSYEATRKTPAGTGLSVEDKIKGDARLLFLNAQQTGRTNCKYRYTVLFKGTIWHVDIFLTGPNAGLILGEVESSGEVRQDIDDIDLPPQVIAEVTGRPEFNSVSIFREKVPLVADGENVLACDEALPTPCYATLPTSCEDVAEEEPLGTQCVSYRIQVYMDDGLVFWYDVSSEKSVREHAAAIVKGGYRHNDGNVFEHYPPHRILKVKSHGISTKYPDNVSGT